MAARTVFAQPEASNHSSCACAKEPTQRPQIGTGSHQQSRPPAPVEQSCSTCPASAARPSGSAPGAQPATTPSLQRPSPTNRPETPEPELKPLRLPQFHPDPARPSAIEHAQPKTTVAASYDPPPDDTPALVEQLALDPPALVQQFPLDPPADVEIDEEPLEPPAQHRSPHSDDSPTDRHTTPAASHTPSPGRAARNRFRQAAQVRTEHAHQDGEPAAHRAISRHPARTRRPTAAQLSGEAREIAEPQQQRHRQTEILHQAQADIETGEQAFAVAEN